MPRPSRLAPPRPALLLGASLLLCAAPSAGAQVPKVVGAGAAAAAARAAHAGGGADSAAAVESPESPRASVRAWLALARAGDWEGAARFLAVPADDAGRGAELARRLRQVLDRRLVLDPGALSSRADGGVPDGTARELVLGTLRAGGATGPVRLRWQPPGRAAADGPLGRWVFSAATVARIDDWYAALAEPAFVERLPAVLRREGPLATPWWQWLGSLAALPLLAGLGTVVGLAAGAVAVPLARRTTAAWDDALVERLRGPVRLLAAALAGLPLLAAAPVTARLAGALGGALRAAAAVGVFWALLRVIRVVQDRLEAGPLGAEQTHTRALIPLVGRSLRVLLAVLAVLSALAALGHDVGTVLAGLGIGGIAVALAAQKTVENLFGSVSLAADRVFRVGDYVRLDGVVEGTVEQIGLRSTQLRTLDRTVVRIPNGKLAEQRVESFGERDRIRLHHVIGIVYGTTQAQMRQLLEAIEAAIRAHPRCWQERVVVRLTGFGPHSLDVQVTAWFSTTDWHEFLAIRQELLLAFLGIVEQVGTSLAFPTQTLHVARGPAHAADGQPGSEAVTGRLRPRATDASASGAPQG